MHFDESAVVEIELEKMRNDQRPETVSAQTAPRSKLSIGKVLLYFVGGLILFRLFGELLSLFF